MHIYGKESTNYYITCLNEVRGSNIQKNALVLKELQVTN